MNLSKVIAIAAEGFKDKYDKGGEPYILHCLIDPENIIQELPYNAERNVPKKRMLTLIEANKMRAFFKNYTWSDFEDDYGRIIIQEYRPGCPHLFIEAKDLAELN